MEEAKQRIELWWKTVIRIPTGYYATECIKSAQKIFPKNKREIPSVILWHRVIEECEHYGVVLPQFFYVPDENCIGLKSKYYASWVIADGNFPERRRLKEMPLSVFEGKYFEALVVDKIECWHNGIPKPEIFWKSKIDIITEVLT